MKKKSKSPARILQILPHVNKILLFVNITVLFCIFFFVILIRFTVVKKNAGFNANQVSLSYFIKRPDLLSSSKALVVYDANAKVILLSKNQNLRFSPASTAKIMTALVALEYYDPKTILTVNALPQNADSSRMGLFWGEKITVLNLLYGLLLPSGSDSADVLAVNYPGGEEGFVTRMNEKTASLGLLNTHFVDPSGYGDDNYTTAYDLARLGAYALTYPTIAGIVKTKEITVHNSNGTIPHLLENLNVLLEIPGVTGIKTGFTNEAEGVLTTSFSFNKKEYVIVVLGSKDRFQDTESLIEGIIKDLRSESLSL